MDWEVPGSPPRTGAGRDGGGGVQLFPVSLGSIPSGIDHRDPHTPAEVPEEGLLRHLWPQDLPLFLSGLKTEELEEGKEHKRSESVNPSSPHNASRLCLAPAPYSPSSRYQAHRGCRGGLSVSSWESSVDPVPTTRPVSGHLCMPGGSG